jgi:hypothetical protein
MFNAAMDDIATTFNTAWPVAIGVGAAGATGSWDSINIAGADIASAGTINLTTATGPNLTITGTTTVTTVTLGAGNVRFARANAAFQLTASANLIINGSASTNYTTTAGDLLIFIGGAGSITRVWAISGAISFATPTQAATLTSTSLAVNPAGLFFLGGYTTTATAAGTTTLTVTSTYHQYFTGSTTQTVVLPVTSTLVLGRSFRVINNSTGLVTVQSSGANDILVLAPGASAIFTVILTSGTTAASWDCRPDGITLSTSIATTSGTTVASPSAAIIPPTAKRVTVMLDGVSINSTSTLLLQLSTGATFVTSGYSSGGSTASGTIVNSTSGFSLNGGNQAQGDTFTGQIILSLMDASANTWVSTGLLYETGTARVHSSSGVVSLSGTLDQVRLNSVTGTATFDAGSVNVSWET